MFLKVTEEHLDVEKGKTLGQVDVYLHEERRNFGIKTTPANKFPEFKEARRISSFLASFKILRIMECYLFQFPACFPTVFVLLFHISQTPLRARSGISPKTKLGQVDEYFPGRQRLGTNFDNILKAAIKVGMQKYAWSRFLGGRLWCFEEAIIQTQIFWTGGRELCSLLGQAAGCPLSGTRSANTWLGPDPNNYNHDILLKEGCK